MIVILFHVENNRKKKDKYIIFVVDSLTLKKIINILLTRETCGVFLNECKGEIWARM